MEELIGLAMIYSWIHGSIIVGKKIQGTTQYEKIVLIAGAVSMALYVIGTANGY